VYLNATEVSSQKQTEGTNRNAHAGLSSRVIHESLAFCGVERLGTTDECATQTILLDSPSNYLYYYSMLVPVIWGSRVFNKEASESSRELERGFCVFGSPCME